MYVYRVRLYLKYSIFTSNDNTINLVASKQCKLQIVYKLSSCTLCYVEIFSV